MSGRGHSRYALIMAMVCTLAVLGCLLLYRVDNKYTAGGPQGKQGVLLLKEGLPEQRLVFLTRGWEYYGGKLLTPEDFLTDPPVPDAHIFLGQYGGFDLGGRMDSSHGSASYRLTLVLPEEPAAYLLELPEIFSAYRLYIGGEEAAAMGVPEAAQYRPETGNRAVAFTASGPVAILAVVSDHNHLYSGMVYPPVFGDPDAVTRLLGARLLFRGVLCAVASTVGLLALLVGALNHSGKQAILYGLLCLLFTGYAGYPILVTFAHATGWSYLVENLCFCGMLLAAMLLHRRMTRVDGKRFHLAFMLAASLCGLSVALRAALPLGGLGLIRAYSATVSLYEWAVALYLTVTAINAVRNGTVQSRVLLCGSLVLDAALVMDRVLPMHEPVITGWFIELASFALVLTVGAAVGLEVARQYLDNALLREQAVHMERLGRMQRDAYELLQEEVNRTITARHDLRHHFVVIGGMVTGGKYDRLTAYLAEYSARLPTAEAVHFSDNSTVNIVVQYYAHLAALHGIVFKTRIDVPEALPLPDSELAALLGNLLENAVESCRRIRGRDTLITFAMNSTGTLLTIHMENSANSQPMLQEGWFLSSKRSGRAGQGLASVVAIVRGYGGEADFQYHEAAGRFVSTILLHI